ncbi:MAG: class I SAM-dependent methyltransferase [Candidatus Hydrogenedentota bacterium]|nr:MAG: class I SAM-dependent methyltransferase [Candidatus Hydrogenedentota bacterium]
MNARTEKEGRWDGRTGAELPEEIFGREIAKTAQRLILGRELRFDPTLSRLDRIYISLLGGPPTGLGIRTRHLFRALAGSGIRWSEVRRVLDAGCGRGLTCYLLAAILPHAEVVGIDSDGERIRANTSIAAALGLRNCRFLNIHLSREDPPPEKDFDLIVSCDCIEHVTDDLGLLTVFAQSLSDSGRLFLHTPSTFRHPLWGRRRLNFDIEGHVRVGYEREELKEKLRRAGFRCVRVTGSFGVLETLANEWEYTVTKARGRNKVLFGFLYPFLNVLCWAGKNASPRYGSAWIVEARKAGL